MGRGKDTIKPRKGGGVASPDLLDDLLVSGGGRALKEVGD